MLKRMASKSDRPADGDVFFCIQGAQIGEDHTFSNREKLMAISAAEIHIFVHGIETLAQCARGFPRKTCSYAVFNICMADHLAFCQQRITQRKSFQIDANQAGPI